MMRLTRRQTRVGSGALPGAAVATPAYPAPFQSPKQLARRGGRRRGSAVAWIALLLSAPVSAAQKDGAARFDWFEYRGDDGQPKPGPGEYANPILQGFYPDPSVVRVGSDYYLVNSTFPWFPGIPVFHSRDLVHWTQIGNAIDRPTQLNFDKMTTWQGVYAPDISWHAGKFYIVNTCNGCGGNFVITATNPAGPWSNPVWLPEIDGIDASLFFDDDGSAWILNNGLPVEKLRYEAHRAIWIQQFDPKLLKPFGPRQVLVDSGVHPEQNPRYIEGPHIFKKDGAYYLIAAEGGTEEGHSEVVFQSSKVNGPYVPFAGNPILTQRDLPRDRTNPITSTGHASFVRTQRGEWWTMFLGVRPYADNSFNTGRETFLMPVRWKDGWPHVTDPGARVPWVGPRPDLPAAGSPSVPTRGGFTVRDEFDRPRLPPYWMMLRNPTGHWWRISGGSLVIEPRRDAFAAHSNPSLLARRQQHMNATATTRVRFDPQGEGSEAGLIAMQNDEHWYFLAIGRENGRRVVRLRRRGDEKDPSAGVVMRTAEVPRVGPVDLRIEARGRSYGFEWRPAGGGWRKLMSGADGTILSTQFAGGFVGSVFGLYAHSDDVPDKHPRLAITFDDLPLHGPIPEGETPLSISKRTAAALKAAGVSDVTGMVNGRWAVTQPETIEALKAWREAGLALGNHTWSHPNLNDTSLAQYEQEIVENEPLLQRLEPGGDWRWLRYPFLAEGDDAAKREAIRSFLAARHYKIADVTMDFGDWQWTASYARCVADHDQPGIDELKRLYLQAAQESIAYYRTLSSELYGRDIPYVLLMHIGALDSYMLPQMLALYRGAGFQFVSLSEAERDSAYREDVNPALPAQPRGLEGKALALGLTLPQRTDYAPLLERICVAPSR